MATEAETRLSKIDTTLAKAGWSERQGNLSKEFVLNGLLKHKQVREAVTSYNNNDERADYILKGRDGKPLAIVEAKRDERDPLEGKRQAEDYAEHVYSLYGVRPFIFLSNGDTHYFWDRERDYPPRKMRSFFTREDLERLLAQRAYSQNLNTFTLNERIAGRGRPYQHEAVQNITQAMEKRQRKFLVVMATGTGKTRTVIGLVDLLLRARWIQRVLFLADRRELVRQAMGEFKEYLPNESRTRIEGGDIDTKASIYLATYPSMMQVYEQLSPGFFDIIIADESHRTIYNRYQALFEHFDAMQLGLTATPTDYIEHNTFELFDCSDGRPTYYYPYELAVEQKHLAKFKTLAAQTNFQVKGIKAGQLSPEFQRYLTNKKIDLNDIDFEGSDLERRVTNTGTNDALVKEFMAQARTDANGTLPAKSIIFAVSHHHAMELEKSFHRLYPDTPLLAEVIDSRIERAEKILDDFKYKDMPRVAISVDMLDTGIDIPAIQTLVFAKPVFSLVKFWQMIGRGTRLWEDPLTGKKKESFLIIDHWRNFDFFDLNPEGETPNVTTPLPVSLFRLRMEKLALLQQQNESTHVDETITQLQAMLTPLPRDNVNISSHIDELERLTDNDLWKSKTLRGFLNEIIAPLLRFTPDINHQIITFEILTEQLALSLLQGEQERITKVRKHIQQSLQLPTGLPQVIEHKEALQFALTDGFWDYLSYERILNLQAIFAPLMRYRRVEHKPMLTLNLPDSVTSRHWILYGPSGEGAFVESYRKQVETHVHNLVDQIPVIYKLKHASEEQLSAKDVQIIADTLNRPDLFITEEILRQIYERSDVGLLDFLRHILGTRPLLTREEQIHAAFNDFIATHTHFTVTQHDIVRAVRSAALRGTPLQPTDLERPPFSRIGRVQQLFSNEEIMALVNLANQFVQQQVA